ncbi:MAG: multi-sensor signal transduction histidine kinase [bacterium]|nr:multi-sensor signal transduction histidine kinase [bacterium]
MTESPLADILEENASHLMAGIEAAVSASTTEVAARRTMERLPELMRGLIEQLRASRPDHTAQLTGLRIRYDVAPLVTATRLLKESIYALIDERQVPATTRETRMVGDWFAAVAESALLGENRRFGAMLDAIPDHLLFYNADGLRIIYVNRAVGDGAKEIAGMSREEVLGHRIVDIVHDQKFGLYVEECLRRVAAGESITEEFIYPSSDGGRWHEQHMRPVYGPDGKVEAITITSRDIHDRKKAEARLQLLSKLGALAETMEHEGIIDTMAHLSIPELADWCLINVVEHGHLQRATIAHRDPAKAVIAEELLRLPSQLHKLRVGKAALAGDSTLIAEIGQATEHSDLVHSQIVKSLDVRSAIVVPFVVMGVPVAIATFMMAPESGRRYGAKDLELAQEMARRAAQIIENARLHQQVRQSEARFRVALDQANISVFETDLELRLRWVYNARLGVPESELIGKTASEILGGESAVDLDELKRRVVETGEGSGTAFSRILDGKRRHLMVRYEPLRGVGGMVGLTGATIDVTELKEAEEQVERELAFRERMMGILGHDLRNPVSAVLGLAGLVRLEEGLSEPAREHLALIEQAARRMNEMIGTLLDFTRLRFHGSLPVAAQEMDLQELVSGVVAELQAAHRRRAIELCARGNLRGRWDPGRIAQLLSNLASNALSHGARESPVSVALAEEGEDVLLSVSNRGPVIPPELVDRLFEPFQQGMDSGGNGRRGLGLGLFIVREIVRAHGVTIDVRSAGDLTTFAVTLPRSAPPS